jgi:tetratricopeptide (TPR) repeat protein
MAAMDRRASAPKRILPDELKHLFSIASGYHRAGLLKDAKKTYGKILAKEPNHVDSLFLLALIAHQTAQDEQALKLISRAIACKHDVPAFYCAAGQIYTSLKRPQQAIAQYAKALALDPNLADAHLDLGLLLQEQHRLDEAAEHYALVLSITPSHVGACNNLGNIYQQKGQLQDAIRWYERALAIDLNHPEACCNLASANKKLGKFDIAAELFRRAIAVKPDFAVAHYNLGILLQEQGLLAESERLLRTALVQDPNIAEAYNALGTTLKELGMLEDAIAQYQRALDCNPELAEAHYNLGTALLLAGQLEHGWPEFEWRWKTVSKQNVRNFAKRQWHGEAAPDKVVLLHAEQGLGDTIQFCRLAPIAAKRANVVLEVQRPLVGLLRGLRGVSQIVAHGDPLPSFDVHCPLLSLPRALNIKQDKIPADIPYLTAEPERVSHWRKVIPQFGFRIGIVWQVNPKSEVLRRRSIPLSYFVKLARIPGVRLISLQKTPGLDHLGEISDETVISLGPNFDSGPDAFLDTAAVVENLDLIITADTATAHLAGALGRPTWVILRHVPHWVWLMDRRDSPWYPTVRLFRQQQKDDWDSVFSRIEGELRVLVRGSTLLS